MVAGAAVCGERARQVALQRAARHLLASLPAAERRHRDLHGIAQSVPRLLNSTCNRCRVPVCVALNALLHVGTVPNRK